MNIASTSSRLGWVCLWLSTVASSVLADQATPVDANLQIVRHFFATFCVGCHGPDKQEGDFRADTLQVSQNIPDAENWRRALDKLNSGEMPPKEAKQPKASEVQPVTAWIQNELARAADRLRSNVGELVLRRMNRTEYRNTIADLFDVHGDFTSGFPEDMRAHGFDNNGGALMLSAAQMQEYMKAAEFVLARAIAPKTRPEMKRVTFTLHDLNREAFDTARKQLKNRLDRFDNLTPFEQQNTRKLEAEATANPRSFGYRFPVFENGRFRPPTADDGPPLDAVMTVQQYFSGEPKTNRFFPIRQPGWYRVRAVAYALKNDGRAVRFKFTAGNPAKGALPKAETIFTLSNNTPREVEASYYLEPGDRVEFTMVDGAPHRQGREFVDQPGPFIAVRSFTMEGPVYDAWPPKGHQTLFGDVDPSLATVEKVEAIVLRLAPKIFRRPVDAGTIKKYRDLYETFRQTMTPEESLRSVLAAMLVSPRFLYFEEPPNESDAYAIASRMSYFLWRSTPDDELLNAAADGSLLHSEGRRAQANRMLADQRKQRFLSDFTGQWLRVREIGVMRANADLYPEYDLELEKAMLGETEHFIAEMFERDLPLTHLIDSDWTMLNERLAKHYGIDGVQGTDIRKVSLDKSKSVRGGLLTHASIHAVTSNGNTTSPVTRGMWVLEKLLGTPVPPPPADVPAIEPDIRGATTIKEQLAKHRQIATCNSCHQKIDPPGFALENFDVIGGWRENYRALSEPKIRNRAKLVDGPPVQSGGEWLGVGRFAGFAEFRDLLKKRDHLVIENVTHQLATFALGRAPGFTDRQPLKDIAKHARDNGKGLKSIVLDLVASPVFISP